MAAEDTVGIRILDASVRPEWVDRNGHMNVASYVTAFEVAVYAIFERFGMGPDYQEETGNTAFAVETHTTYKRELGEGAPYVITGQILAYDDKRIHNFLRMYDKREGFVAATIEWLGLHIDLGGRRVAPWPLYVREGIEVFVEEQGPAVPAREVGHRIRIRKPTFDIYGDET